MRVISLNLNGIRAAARKGFFDWLALQNADFICVQEIKAQEAQLQSSRLRLEGYTSYFHCAEKRGYSGVGIYARNGYQPKKVIYGLGFDTADQEGRHVGLVFSNFVVSSIYLPSGTSGSIRQAIKFDFLDQYIHHLKEYLASGNEHIICGDWNIAHKQIDLKNWRANQVNSGFLPEERAWMDKLTTELGYVDAFRVVNKLPDQYTWWSNRGQAWDKNVGWRIDYQIITPGLKSSVKSVSIYKDERFSDHAPLIIDYKRTAFLRVC